MSGIIPIRTISTPPSSAPPPRSVSFTNRVTGIGSRLKSTAPIDFRGIRRQGLLRGIRNTHHFQRGLYRQLKSIFPDSSDYKLREQLTEIIESSINKTSGAISREYLRRELRGKSMGVGRIMNAAQRKHLFRATGLDKIEGNPLLEAPIPTQRYRPSQTTGLDKSGGNPLSKAA